MAIFIHFLFFEFIVDSRKKVFKEAFQSIAM